MAQTLSVAGDQLARVALTLLVFDRTHSALLAAVTFAASLVPTFIGALTLSKLADRYPRREVMIVCDLLRGGLVAVMVTPGMPVAALVALLFLVTLISAPFSAARAALTPDILAGDRYVLGTAITITTMQFAQVVGFAAGGAVVGFFGVRTSLLADAATFGVSALLTRGWVGARPAARPAARAGGSAAGAGPRAGWLAGARLVFTDHRLRTPLLFGWLAAFYDVPEGVVAPLAAGLGGSAIVAGLILASSAFGSTVGALGFGRLVAPAVRLRWLGPLGIASSAVLMLFGLHPDLAGTLAILTASGLFSCYQLAANAAFVSAAPPELRSEAFGVAQGGMNLLQGAAMILAGAAAQHVPPWTVIAASGALGSLCAAMAAVSNTRRDER